MSNNGLVTIESDYEYILGLVQGNVLNLQANFAALDWTREELYIISKELENTGKKFAEEQGLRKTGHLIDSTHAVVNGNTIDFFNNANIGNGFYAGHIEYGYHTKKGDFVPARPFMRPALYAVAEASKGQLQGALQRYLNQVVLGAGSINNLYFGRAMSSENYTRVFYRQQTLGRGASSNTGHYTSGGLSSNMNRQGAFWDIRSNENRMSMSVIRDRDESRLMTNRFSLDRNGRNSATRRYQYYGTNPGRTGRPGEGRERISSGRGRGRPATGRVDRRTGNPPGRPRNGQPSKQRTGRKRGRPAKYAGPHEWPSKQRSNRGRGRPAIYNSPEEWPSRQPTGNKRGRPKKNRPSQAANPYKHGTIKRDIKPSKTAKEYAANMHKAWNKQAITEGDRQKAPRPTYQDEKPERVDANNYLANMYKTAEGNKRRFSRHG